MGTINGGANAGAASFSLGDVLTAGAGTDTLILNDLSQGGADATLAAPVGSTISSFETLTINGATGVNADITAAAWADVTTLNVNAVSNAVVVAPAGDAVNVVATATPASGASSVNGGTNVSVKATTAALANGATGATITLGATTAVGGAVSVTNAITSSSVTDGGAGSPVAGAIAVTGGTTVTVAQTAAPTTAVATSVKTGNHSTTLVQGAVTITGTATTTSATVTQSATVAAVKSATVGVYGITAGAVTINDVNAGDATKAGSIASVSLTNFGNSTVDSSALTSVTLGGTGGTMGIGRGALTAVPTANTLALNTNALTGTNTITDSEAAADDGFTTINLTNTGTTVIADLVAADLTTLNIAGSGNLTLTANTLGGASTTTIVNTSTGTVTLSGALTAAANYTGAEGVDKVTAGASATGTISTGAGDDTITASTLGTAGRINGGDGTDTLLMAAADAATATASAAFAAKVTNVERLSLGAYADATGVTVNLANMNNYNHVTSAGGVTGGAARAQAISGFTTGGTFNQTALFNTNQNVTLSGAAFSAGTNDSFNLGMTGTDGYANVGVLTLADIETLAITTTDSDTTAATTAFDPNLDSTSVKSVTITGNAGITFANSDLGTALTSFNASGVTVGSVTYTTAALAAAATITGGAGNDTLSGASAAVAGVTINGGAGNDTITGSATKANTLNGDAGNDSITGGSAADVIDGGAGTNTYVFSSANVVEQAGSGTTTGAVINLSANAITSTAVFTASGAYLSNLSTGVASGTSTYLFSNESNTNASVVDTLANIQNVTGTDLADYIVGSDAANTITGAAGADILTGGAGADKFVYTTVTDSAVAGGIDKITDLLLNGSTGDTLDFTLIGTLTVRTAAVAAALTAADTVAEITGLFNSTNGTEAVGEQFTGGTNATAVLATFTDGTLLLVDVNGDGAFTTADVVINVTGVTTTSFTTAVFV
jgi:S-layer protein